MKPTYFVTLLYYFLLLVKLMHDYKRDSGQNILAKICHAIILIAIGIFYAKALLTLAYLGGNIDWFYNKVNSPVGIISGPARFTILVLHTLLAVAICLFAMQMFSRKDRARRLFISFLPFLAITEIFNFYLGWLSEGPSDIPAAYIFLIGTIAIGCIAVLIVVIYSSRFMRKFFTPEAILTTNEHIEILDSPSMQESNSQNQE